MHANKYNIKNQIMDDVQYCGCHPLSRRDYRHIKLNGEWIEDKTGEGLIISGFMCPHRRLTDMGYQSFCQRHDRIAMGCESERHALEYSSKEMWQELMKED